MVYERNTHSTISKHILVCDDIADNCFFLKIVLELEGYIVDTVTSGEAALDKIQAHKPDLLILDLMMSGMNGAEVVQHIQFDPRMQSLPILIITGSPEMLRDLRVFELRVNGILKKPMNPDVFIAKVQEILQT